jgi:hypothetical protein
MHGLYFLIIFNLQYMGQTSIIETPNATEYFLNHEKYLNLREKLNNWLHYGENKLNFTEFFKMRLIEKQILTEDWTNEWTKKKQEQAFSIQNGLNFAQKEITNLVNSFIYYKKSSDGEDFRSWVKILTIIALLSLGLYFIFHNKRRNVLNVNDEMIHL